MTRHATVAALVRRRCPDADVLLEMLGLVVDGRVTPDDDRDYGDVDTAQLGSRASGERSSAAFDDMRIKPAVSTAPDALRNLPALPEAVKPAQAGVRGGRGVVNEGFSAAARARNKANEAPCGTPAAKRRHRRRGEPVCAVCAPVPLTEPNGAARKAAYRRAKGIKPRNFKNQPASDAA